ncbi:UDP-glucose 4-epimerase GalE [Alteribacillus bidgolensis]|uniref:UDP-glucose 4-epimerase n=1 Tax=Alteribacillus bidgolensis TaxID=930129 RepID=A0A1G8HLK0_9BACI|nr:UDP-glucose 4-epimerase GalE [Alteribacillus bidgolensis]SDI07523.1 UDP-galactose 4-epimerase [Alteribacillus bidgolensis]
MSVLVVGGAGYVGSHAVHQLLEQGKQPVVVDNLQTGHLEALPRGAVFYKGDVRDRAFMRNVFKRKRIRQVMMFSAHSLVGESIENPLQYYDNNVFGIQVLLETMIEANVKKIVFSSTAAVYREPEEVPFTEEARANPESPYEETKWAIEKMMKWCEKAHGLRYVSLRYFNAAGARSGGLIGEDHRPETHLIPIILEAAMGKREAVTVFGEDYPTADGTCIRDYIHVEDVIAAHLKALNHLKKGGHSDVFNLGSSEGFSIKEIIEAARTVTGKQITVTSGERRAGGPARLIVSSEKAKKMLGWEPKRTDIHTIIKDAWNWHSLNPQGYGGRPRMS